MKNIPQWGKITNLIVNPEVHNFDLKYNKYYCIIEQLMSIDAKK